MSTQHQSASTTTLAAVFAALMVLLGATYGAATIDLGYRVNLAVALTIAVVKAVLIILYFMGVRFSSQRVWLFAGAGFFWLIIMLGILDDYVTRGMLG